MNQAVNNEQASLIREANAVTDVITISGKARRKLVFKNLRHWAGKLSLVFGKAVNRKQVYDHGKPAGNESGKLPQTAAAMGCYRYCSRPPQSVLS